MWKIPVREDGVMTHGLRNFIPKYNWASISSPKPQTTRGELITCSHHLLQKISVVLPSGENFTTHSSGIRELQNNMLRNSDTWEKSMIKCQLFFLNDQKKWLQSAWAGKTNGGNPFHRKESISFLHCELGLWHLATNVASDWVNVEISWHLFWCWKSLTSLSLENESCSHWLLAH